MKVYYVQPYKRLYIKVRQLSARNSRISAQPRGAVVELPLWMVMCSFIFFSCLFFISSNAEEEQESALTEESVHSGQLKAKRAGFRSARSKSESSAARSDSKTARYLSWENVSFIGQELRKTVSKGFQWIASPSLGKIRKNFEGASRIKTESKLFCLI